MKPLFRRIITHRLQAEVVRLIRRNPDLKIVAVGGSIGKTSTKLAIATVLSKQYRVLVQEGNYNSPVGLPLGLFEEDAPGRITDIAAWTQIFRRINEKLKKPFPYDVAVVELGTDHPGDIGKFMRYLKPDIGVVTGVAPEHMENFHNLKAVADEEFTLARHSRIAVLNGEFDELVTRSKKLSQPVIIYDASATLTGMLTPTLLGRPARLACAAAVVVARQMEVSEGYILAGVKAIKPVPGRMQRLEGTKNTTLLDDTYNAAPDSVKEALNTLKSTATGRRIAVLGQMNELGNFTQEAHESVGMAAGDVDILVTLGDAANRYLGPAAVAAGLPKDHWHKFDSPYSAGEWLVDAVELGDTILFKGSQNGVFAEEVLKLLLADQSDSSRLVRQSPDWLARKAKQFEV